MPAWSAWLLHINFNAALRLLPWMVSPRELTVGAPVYAVTLDVISAGLMLAAIFSEDMVLALSVRFFGCASGMK